MYKINRNKFAFLLLIPVLIFYTGYFFNYAPGYKPTGFIQYDNISYVAYAKQYVDHPGKSIGYSNPLNDSGDYPSIYFQTQTLMLAALLKMGIDPGIAICIFSILFCFLAIRTAISVYDELYPDSVHRTKTIILFIWGGGIISLSCMLLQPLMTTELNFWSCISYFDPEDGWWGLNFGRSLIFGTESYYHFLFFAAVLMLLRKKWVAASLIAFILSFSHPFTGIHLLLLLLTWISIDRFIFKNRTVPWWMFVVVPSLIATHLFYYLVYLPSFADHKSVSEQYSVNWNYWHYRSLPAFIPAYIIVFVLFLASLKLQRVKKFIASSNNRLLLCLAVVSLLLCNHDLFIKPMQPIHFARGYEWSAYFLMAVPFIHYAFNRLLPLKVGKILIGIFFLLFLSDNILWITKYVRTPRGNETTISKNQEEIIQVLQKHTDNSTLLIGSDLFLMPYSAVYTKGYPWISHPYTTPYFPQKKKAYNDFIQFNTVDSLWYNRKCILIFNMMDSAENVRSKENYFNGELLFSNERSQIIKGYFKN